MTTQTQPNFFDVLTGAQATAAPALQELPMNWEWAKLEDVAIIVRGVSYSKEFASNEPKTDFVPILRANNIQEAQLNLDDLVYLPQRFVDKSQMIRSGDIVIAMSSGSKNLVGKAGQAQTDYQAAFGTFCGVVRPKGNLENKFIGYFFQSSQYRDVVRVLSSGSNINNLRSEHITQQDFPIPPLLEQKRIVAKLEELLSELEFGVKTLKIALAKVKKYRQSVLKAAVQGDLSKAWREAQGDSLEPAGVLLERVLLERKQKWVLEQQAKGKKNAKYTEPQAPDSSGLGELPPNWVWTTAGCICDCIVPNRDKPQSFTGDIPWITIPDFDSSSLHISKAKSGLGLTREEVQKYRARLIPENSVIMTCVGRFGIAATTKLECVINQQLHAFLSVPQLIPEYLTIALMTQKSYMDKKANATTIAYLNKESCNSVPLPLPPFEEQAFIVSQVEAKLSATDHLENSIKANLLRAERLRASTLNMAFSGKLVPQDENDEPASVLLERIRALRVAEGGRKKL
jgi:type I restriction enzyme, S subunit